MTRSTTRFYCEEVVVRNDSLDELESIPSVGGAVDAPAREAEYWQQNHSLLEKPRRSRWPIVLLSALVLALLVAVTALAYWGQQQVTYWQQQLQATQTTFSKLSENAEQRLSNISGQIDTASSQTTQGTEQLRMALKNSEQQVQTLVRELRAVKTELASLQGRQEQQTAKQAELSQQQTALKTAVAALTESQSEWKAPLKILTERTEALTDSQRKQAASVAALADVADRLKEQERQIAQVKTGDQSAAVKRLEQDLLVLRSEIELGKGTSSGSSGGVSLGEFDGFRSQVLRRLTALEN